MFGNYILGSTLPLEECKVTEPAHIDEVCDRIVASDAVANQVRVIMIKIPRPEIPPMVIALLPTKGKDTAENVHALFLKIIKMAAQLNMKVLTAAANGASLELRAQCLMDNVQSEEAPLTYDYKHYGISLGAPVFKTTGPLISISDAPHGRKTCRNQPQHGTHTASLGKGYMVSHSLFAVYEKGDSGLVLTDVRGCDKQDDGAASRICHVKVLEAMTKDVEKSEKRKQGETSDHNEGTETTNKSKTDDTRKEKIVEKVVIDEFLGTFVYLFVLGSLFDACLSRHMTHRERAIAAVRARIFLHIWREHLIYMESIYPDLYSLRRSFISPESFNIFNRICDTLLLQILAYARYYPQEPFCPWLMGTEFVEHFFGLARMMLPDFNYSELIAISKHAMLRQKILLTGNFTEYREKNSRVGYSFDFDNRPLTVDDMAQLVVSMTTKDLDDCVEQGAKEARELCKQLLGMHITQKYDLVPISKVDETKLRKGRGKDKRATSNAGKEAENTVTVTKSRPALSKTLEAKLTLDSESDLELDIPIPAGVSSLSTTEEIALDDDNSDSDDFHEQFDDDDDDDDEEEEEEEEAVAGDEAVASAARSAARLSALEADYETRSTAMEQDLEEMAPSSQSTTVSQTKPHLKEQTLKTITSDDSIFDTRGRVSISKILALRKRQQSMATRHSERTFQLDPKYELSKVINGEKEMTTQEASQRLRIRQSTALAVISANDKKPWQIQWQTAPKKIATITKNKEISEKICSKNISHLNPLKRGNFVIMYKSERLYIGEVLDIYKQGTNGNRYGSIDIANLFSDVSYLSLRVYLSLTSGASVHLQDESSGEDSDDEDFNIIFSCRSALKSRAEIHTHGFAKNIVWNLGDKALLGKRDSKLLQGPAKLFWREFERENMKSILKEAVQSKLAKETDDITEQPKYQLLGVPPVKKC